MTPTEQQQAWDLARVYIDHWTAAPHECPLPEGSTDDERWTHAVTLARVAQAAGWAPAGTNPQLSAP